MRGRRRKLARLTGPPSRRGCPDSSGRSAASPGSAGRRRAPWAGYTSGTTVPTGGPPWACSRQRPPWSRRPGARPCRAGRSAGARRAAPGDLVQVDLMQLPAAGPRRRAVPSLWLIENCASAPKKRMLDIASWASLIWVFISASTINAPADAATESRWSSAWVPRGSSRTRSTRPMGRFSRGPARPSAGVGEARTRTLRA
jgi:hypothetical protein